MKYFISLLIVWLGMSTGAQAATTLESAAKSGRADLVRSLLDGGTDVNTRYDIGRTALMVAAVNGRVDVLDVLIQAGADLDARDNNGETALMLAAEYNHLPAVKNLVESGADPTIQTGNGFTAKELTQRVMLRERDHRMEVIIKYLAQHPNKKIVDKSRAEKPGADSAAAPGRVDGAAAGSTRPQRAALAIATDLSEYKPTPERFHQAALQALKKRGWSVTLDEAERVGGSLDKKDALYKVEIRYIPPQALIYFIAGFDSSRSNWLYNLESDLRAALQSLPVQ